MKGVVAVVLACLSIVLALSALGFCWFLYTEVSKRVLSTAVSQLLKQSSEELSKDYARQFRSIETEWDDMYQKFSRLAGRMDREKRLTPSETPGPVVETPPPPASRSELLKRWRTK